MTRRGWIVLGLLALLLLRARPAFAIKAGATLSTRPEIVFARSIVATVYRAHGYTLTVTSGIDSKHGAQSLHDQGLAEDYRTREIAAVTVASMASEIRARLGAAYDVIVESDHLHVEFDPS